MKGLVEDLRNAADGQVVLLHSCAHNPTGVDPSLAQWKEISKVCKDKKHFVIFDNAYQGNQIDTSLSPYPYIPISYHSYLLESSIFPTSYILNACI
jgi:aspartate/tyrosine/aromatic aminotransferase